MKRPQTRRTAALIKATRNSRRRVARLLKKAA